MKPVFHGPALLDVGDAVASTRVLHDHAGNPAGFEPATFMGYVTEPVRHDLTTGYYSVTLDTGIYAIRPTRTLAIWYRGAR